MSTDTIDYESNGRALPNADRFARRNATKRKAPVVRPACTCTEAERCSPCEIESIAFSESYLRTTGRY